MYLHIQFKIVMYNCYVPESRWKQSVQGKHVRKYCNRYRNQRLENVNGYDSMDRVIRDNYPDFTFNEDLFQPWYIYELFHIDIVVTPMEVLSRIENVAQENLGRGIQVLKF